MDHFGRFFSGQREWNFKPKETQMLVLSRKAGERICIGEDISVTVVRISGGGVRIGIEAPKEMPVIREELKRQMNDRNSADFGGTSTAKSNA